MLDVAGEVCMRGRWQIGGWRVELGTGVGMGGREVEVNMLLACKSLEVAGEGSGS